MHENPVRRGLVSDPGLWRWSSYRGWKYNEAGPVTLGTPAYPTLLLAQKGGAPAEGSVMP